MDWQSTFTFAGTLFVLASAIGLGLMRGTLGNLRSSNDDLRSRVADLEKNRTEDRAELAEVAAENKTLKAMLTGKVEWTAISDQLEEHHRQSLASWKRLGDGIKQIHLDLTRGK